MLYLSKTRKFLNGGKSYFFHNSLLRYSFFSSWSSPQFRELIFQMVRENPTWSAPRIHGELQMLGFEVSENHRFPLDETSNESSILPSGGRRSCATTVRP